MSKYSTYRMAGEVQSTGEHQNRTYQQANFLCTHNGTMRMQSMPTYLEMLECEHLHWCDAVADSVCLQTAYSIIRGINVYAEWHTCWAGCLCGKFPARGCGSTASMLPRLCGTCQGLCLT